ncbi:MAG: hypothetical protein PUF78_01825, partial [Lachnospiraceae bacterium]|nr:hypothetical protein [Lachnospiraceae bacterium]
MKNKLRKVLSKEIPISVLKKTLALLLAFLMVVTSGDFSGLYAKAGGPNSSETNSSEGKITVTGTNVNGKEITLSVPKSKNAAYRQLSAYDILGEAWNYGVTANNLNTTNDSETNFAVKNVIKFPDQSGVTDKGFYSESCDSYIGHIDDNCSKPLIIKGNGQNTQIHPVHRIHTPYPMADNNGEIFRAAGVTIQIVPTSERDVYSYIDQLMNAVKTQAKYLSDSERNSIDSTNYSTLQKEMAGAGGITLDISKEEDGTYYFDLDQFPALYNVLSSQTGGLTITKKAGQSIVFNSNKTEIKTM